MMAPPAGSCDPSTPHGPRIETRCPPVDGVTAARIRRLSNVELGNAIEALTGVRPAALAMLPPDARDYGFDRVAQSQTVSDGHLEAGLLVAEEVAARMLPARVLPAGAPCDGATSDQPVAARRDCAAAFVDDFGARAFRRPLGDDDRTTMLALYDGAGTFGEGLAQLVRFVLNSADFLYVIERGSATDAKTGFITLTDHEVATRLALMTCETLPDEELRRAADASALHDPDQIAAQADRLLGQPCARQTVKHFYDQWLGLAAVGDLTRDATLFPEFDASLRASMVKEDELFLDDVTWGGGVLADLFRADHSFVDAKLGAFYGLAGLGDSPRRVALPPQRRGLLTHASFLALEASARDSAPIRRGAFVLRKLLCGTLGPPPANADTSVPPFDPNLTTRQRFEQRTQSGVCGGCHSLINPIGYTLENFDATGHYRTEEHGQPIDASGSVPELQIDGLVGGAALGAAIADRAELAVCLASHWLRFGLGRLETQADMTSVAAVADAARGRPLQQAMVELARTFAFRHRAIPKP
jgi:hypothetical protein